MFFSATTYTEVILNVVLKNSIPLIYSLCYPTRNVILIYHMHISDTYICVFVYVVSCIRLLCISSQQALQALSLIGHQPSGGCPFLTLDAPSDQEGNEAFSSKFEENWKHV